MKKIVFWSVTENTDKTEGRGVERDTGIATPDSPRRVLYDGKIVSAVEVVNLFVLRNICIPF